MDNLDPKITKENIDSILAFLPYFANRDNKFYKIHQSKEGVFMDPYDYSGETLRFIEKLYENNFIICASWTDWKDMAAKRIENPRLIDSDNLQTLCQILTVIVRNDRFCSGIIANMIDRGIILRILQRINKIKLETRQ